MSKINQDIDKNINELCFNSGDYKKYRTELQSKLIGTTFLSAIVALGGFKSFIHLMDETNPLTFISLFIGIGAFVVFAGALMASVYIIPKITKDKIKKISGFMTISGRNKILKNIKLSPKDRSTLENDVNELRSSLGEDQYKTVMKNTMKEIKDENSLLFYETLNLKSKVFLK